MNIDRDNYESFFLLYVDRELGPAEMLEVEKFVTENADLQKELGRLQQTVYSQADSIGFPDKEILFRREDKRRVISFYRLSVAAAILLAIAGCWFLLKSVNIF